MRNVARIGRRVPQVSILRPGIARTPPSYGLLPKYAEGIWNRPVARQFRNRTFLGANSKSAAQGQRFCEENQEGLQRRFDLKPPGLEQRLRDILGILVTPRPLPKTGGPDILVRGQLELLHDLLEGGYSRHNRADGLRLAPVRISTTLCHRFCVLSAVSECGRTSLDGVGGSCLSRGINTVLF